MASLYATSRDAHGRFCLCGFAIIHKEFWSETVPCRGMMPAKTDEDPFEDGQGTFESLVLGLAYTVAKDKEETPRWFVVIRLAAEFLQLW
jgi:hypothetical protein